MRQQGVNLQVTLNFWGQPSAATEGKPFPSIFGDGYMQQKSVNHPPSIFGDGYMQQPRVNNPPSKFGGRLSAIWDNRGDFIPQVTLGDGYIQKQRVNHSPSNFGVRLYTATGGKPQSNLKLWGTA